MSDTVFGLAETQRRVAYEAGRLGNSFPPYRVAPQADFPAVSDAATPEEHAIRKKWCEAEAVRLGIDPPINKKAGKPSLGKTGDPKKEAGAAKPSMNNVSPVAEFYEGAVMDGGAIIYGEYNWAEHRMEAKTYYNAIRRHIAQWWLGEELDIESGLPHLAHIRACCAILIEQQATNHLIDNRPKNLASLQKAFDVIGEAKTK